MIFALKNIGMYYDVVDLGAVDDDSELDTFVRLEDVLV